MVEQKLEKVSPLTEQEYANTFATLKLRSTGYDAMINIARKVIQESNFDTNPVRMLSIGAGHGNFEVRLVRELNLKLEYIYAIEPNPSHLEPLQSALQSVGVKHDISTAHFTKKFIFTEIEEKDGDCNKFDLILLSYVLFYFDDPYEIIVYASNFLKPSGKMLILTIADQCINVELYNYLLNRTPEVFMKTIADYSLTPEKIVRNVGEMCSTLRFSVTKELAHVLLDSFVRKIETPEKDDVVSFLLQTNYSSLSEEAQDCVNEIVAAACDLIEGKFWLQKDVAGILVFHDKI